MTALRASNNNRASTALSVFFDGVREFGVPRRVRGDRGGENVEISVWMVMRRGPNRGSFLWGPCVSLPVKLSLFLLNFFVARSTTNSRAERIWGETGSHFCRPWRAFFLRLERLHKLLRGDGRHLWLIHKLFLPMINNDCDGFRVEWNHHPITGPKTHNMSPNVSLKVTGIDKS